ncbi:hypothetical protein [Synoicihabitans lomoniglobus]|uniref:Uncharacterized protein n=1 Tax=Synoicihabitans lomoniglobus TaxID=2909285 RepID=A0AAE9ZVN9_9BACT|nr:hypothetical protein [Opitutaceae bacterium LMO-M01]WED63700.1 hypothetical protein PXH66_15295 [Opitutaceae bacterium LMO-M01]
MATSSPYPTRRHHLLPVVRPLLFGLGAALSTAAAPFQLPDTGAPASTTVVLLAIDDHAFPLRDNLALYLTTPTVRAEPVLQPSVDPNAPDNAATHFYGSVIREENRFRMWYYAVHTVSTEGAIGVSPVCYAESIDGEIWTRPHLGQVDWKGNRDNNLVALGPDPTEACSGVSVIRDDTDPDPARRYKMVFGKQIETAAQQRLGVSRRWVVRTAVSPDGLTWTQLPQVVSGDQFAELSSLYHHNGLYVVNSHIRSHGEGDRQEGRQGYAWVSPDFTHWLPQSAPSFKTAEPLDGAGWGTHGNSGDDYTQVHLGVGATSLGNVAIGLYGMWHQRQPNWGEGGITCDLGLLLSQDGLHFNEVVKGQPYLRSEQSPAKPVAGKAYPTILCQTNSILNVGDETWIYHGRWRNVDFQQLGSPTNDGTNVAQNYWGGVALAKLPRDRWGALALWAESDQGSLWTTPITLPAAAALTANAAGLSGLTFLVADERFNPIEGFAAGRAPATDDNDQFDAAVIWAGHDLAELAGQTVRLRVSFDRGTAPNPQLFALNLTPSSDE